MPEIDPPYEHHEYYPKDISMPVYDNENPHPEYGKNPNIRNIQGHTEYPKYVFPKGVDAIKANFDSRVLVNNPEEEAKATGKSNKDKKPAAWDTE
jgi:hypothetical protein